jgi:Uma2 family endonuclease
MATKTLLTVEQFLQTPEYIGQDSKDGSPPQYELDEGEVVEMASPNIRHQSIGGEIYLEVGVFAKQTKLGRVFYETDIQLDSNTIYRPDVTYWDAAHFATIDPTQNPVLIIPQFVVEVVSPSNPYRKLMRRAAKFQRAGVHTVWIVNDDPLEIQVFEPSRRRIVTADGTLTVPELLPGFSLPVSQLLPSA